MSIELSFNERRVLGVLIEKGFTTPEQYPLSLNGVVVGSNQKSCREPQSGLDEEQVHQTLETLREKGFTTLVRIEGARVDKWKHRVGEKLAVQPKELALVAELLLRGAQTDGELRQRAGRMRPLESLEEVEQILESLRSRPEPLVERLGPPGRRRGVKYAHTFYPPSDRPKEEGDWTGADEALPLHENPAPLEHVASSPPRYAPAGGPPPSLPAAASSEALVELRREIEALKERVSELEATFVKFLK